MRLVKSLWERLSDNGIRPEHDFTDTKRIRIINRFSIIGIYIALSYTIFLLILSEPLLALLDFAIVVAGVIVMVLLKYYNYRIAAVFMFLSIPVTLLLLNVFYGRVGGEFYFFSMFILAYYIFPKRKFLLPILIYMVLMFMLSKYFSVSIVPEGTAKILAPYFYYINITCTFIIAAIFLQLFVTEHLYYQKQIEEKNKRIEDDYRKALNQNKRISLLLRELNHRVKNNLQLVTSLISIQAVKVKDVEARDILEESVGRISSISLMHERMYLQQDETPHISLNEYMKELFEHFQGTTDEDSFDIELDSETGDFRMHFDLVLPIGLIMNEIITNAVKHRHKSNNSGLLKVIFRLTGNDMLEIEIQNNGKGVEKIIHADNKSSFGTTLIHSLLRQLKGSITMTGSSDDTLLLTIPANQELYDEGHDC